MRAHTHTQMPTLMHANKQIPPPPPHTHTHTIIWPVTINKSVDELQQAEKDQK